MAVVALGVGLAIAAPAALPGSALSGSGSAAAATTSVGLWTGDPIPSTPAAADSAAVELGTRFASDVSGSVTGVRFYKGVSNTGRHMVRLWDSSGRTLASTTSATETASGWQSVSFAAPVRVTAGQTYTVSYHTTVGRYAATQRYFDTARRTGPLRAPANAGVYRYGTGGYPTSTYNGSNYWVDVQFAADVTSVAPAPSPSASPMPTASATPTAAPSPSATATATSVLAAPAAPAPGTRNKYLWPFAAGSIWNAPVGSGAAYLPLGLSAPTTAYGTDEVHLALEPTAPLRPLVDRGYWWPWKSGSSVVGTNTGVSVRVPDNWLVSAPSSGDYPNNASAALQADGTVREWQYTVRPTSGSNISMFERPRANYSITGDGLQGSQFGSHGGSGMISLGGTLRSGELTGSAPIRHALALTMNMRKWGTKQGGNITNGYRWPATAADSYYGQSGTATGYGTITTNGGQSKNGLGMGSLLAIPASVDLASMGFETAAGAKLAWTHQNYGAYVVDDSMDPGSWDVHRLNVEASVLREYPAIDTYPGTNTPFGRDMNKIFTRLAVVDNNSTGTIGGGGTPRQPLAPAFGN